MFPILRRFWKHFWKHGPFVWFCFQIACDFGNIFGNMGKVELITRKRVIKLSKSELRGQAKIQAPPEERLRDD